MQQITCTNKIILHAVVGSCFPSLSFDGHNERTLARGTLTNSIVVHIMSKYSDQLYPDSCDCYSVLRMSKCWLLRESSNTSKNNGWKSRNQSRLRLSLYPGISLFSYLRNRRYVYARFQPV